jgi:hypothetical protein
MRNGSWASRGRDGGVVEGAGQKSSSVLRMSFRSYSCVFGTEWSVPGALERSIDQRCADSRDKKKMPNGIFFLEARVG